MNIKRLFFLTGAVLSGLTLVSLWFLFITRPPELARAAGDTHTVCLAGPPLCDYSVIQEAVDAALDGDVIKVAVGTYDDINNRYGHPQIVNIDKSITIKGGYTTAFTEPPDPVANPTTLDAGGLGRVIYIEGNITSTIEGLRITGGDTTIIGSVEGGGGVKIAESASTLRQNVIFNNTAGTGGGVDMSDCAATLEGNTIISNTATKGGGGLWMWQCDNSTLSENTISFNSAYTQAGGLWSGGASVNININDNTFSNNSSEVYAGGLELQGQGYSLVGNTISSNTAPGIGGIFLLAGESTLINNSVISNTGGGVNLYGSENNTFIGNNISYNIGQGLSIDGDNIMIRGNTISHNAAEWGAGISTNGNNIIISGNTISFNSATHGGGGFFGSGSVTLVGNSFISNTAEMGGGLLSPDATGVQIIGNTFSKNSASSQGGGLDLWDGNPILTNNLIVDNHSDGTSSALNLRDTSSRLLHNTIARNSGGGSGINIDIYLGSSTITLTNNIIVSHTVGLYAIGGASVSLESTLWGDGIWANGTNWAGDGTIIQTNEHSGDPDFVDYLAGDYHIGENSDAKDKGIDAGVTRDIDNHPRPYQLPDIGADEYWPPGALKFIYLPLTTR